MVGRICIALLGVTCGITCLVAEEPNDGAPSPHLRAEIRQLIGDLNADQFETREAASRRLSLIGPPAADLLEEASQATSPEVRYRASLLLRTIHTGPLRGEIESFCALPEELLDLEQGMYLIARILNPPVRKRDLTRQLDEIAQQVRKKLGEKVDPAMANPHKVVEALRGVLFDDLKFSGNKDDFHHPDNSSL